MSETIATTSGQRRAVYPGSFNPPSIAHLAIAELAVEQRGLDSVTFAVSQVALAKESVGRPLLEHRLDVIRASLAPHPRFDLEVTEHQLLADIADGYEVIVMGADKWEQIHDPVFYNDDPHQRDQAIARLPEVALVPRPPHEIDPRSAQVLDVPSAVVDQLHDVSSSLARRGRRDLMTAAAQAFDERTGAWTNPARYERFLYEAGAAERSRD